MIFASWLFCNQMFKMNSTMLSTEHELNKHFPISLSLVVMTVLLPIFNPRKISFGV